jgi:hypothetical protein
MTWSPRPAGRCRAVEGKTWNLPVIVDGKLYVRNATIA